jgi:hypothetical protein
MLPDGAYVGSLAAMQAFQAALANFVDQAKQSLTMIDMEARRAVDWVRIDRAEYWKQEVRRAGEAVNRAKDELHHCLTFKSTEDFTPSCIDERKALERAQRRLKLAEQKIEAVRHWSRALQHEVNEYSGRVVQFNAVLENDIPKAMISLTRMLDMLDRYITTTAPRPLDESALERAGSLNVDAGQMSRGDAETHGDEETPVEVKTQTDAKNDADAEKSDGDAEMFP